MKGVVMNLLADMVEQTFGLPEWNAILAEAGLSGIYTATAIYEDEELLKLVGIISERSGLPVEDLVYRFGEFMFPAFHERYPALIDDSPDLLTFLTTVDGVIHVEVNKLYPGAITPAFEHESIDEKTLVLRYRSERKMCRLAEGLIAGAAQHFGAAYELQHDPCLLEGADHCGFRITLQ